MRLQFELLQGTCGYVNLFPHAIRIQQSHAEFSQADFFFFLFFLQEGLKRTLNLNIVAASHSLCIQATVTM